MPSKHKKKKKKLNKKRLFLILIFITLIFLGIYSTFNRRLKNIIIEGNNLLTDAQIIRKADLKDYPKMAKISKNKVSNKLLEMDLIDSVEIDKTMTGKITITVVEKKVMLYDRTSKKLVLSDGTKIEDTFDFIGVPILINYVPDTTFKEFLKGLTSVNEDIVSQISEIEYSPSKNSSGDTLDDTRFKLNMNDGNIVYVNVVNITRLNNYLEIYASLEDKKGIIQLDSSNDSNVYVNPFGDENPKDESGVKDEN